MFPGLFPGGKLPGEDFINSAYPIFIALALGALYGFRSYMRGAQCRSQERLTGKVAIVTGASTGIGLEIARELAKRGAHVILACRDEIKAKAGIDDIKALISDASLEFIKLDLASLQSVRDFVISFSQPKLDILINNAGIMCHPQERTADGFELHFQVNYLGHFLLTHLLLNKLKASPSSRIINVSAAAYQLGELSDHLDDLQFERREYKTGDAYSQSKLAIMLFTHYLAKHLEGSKVTVNAVNPGVVRTNVHRHMPFRKNVVISWSFAPFLWFLMKSSRDGAQTSIHCAVAKEEEGVSGKYYTECKIEEPKPVAVDDETAERLWNISLLLCGLKQKQLQSESI